MHVQGLVWEYIFIFLGVYIRVQFPGHMVNSMFNILRNFQIIFQSGLSILYSHHQYMSVPIS